MRLENIFESLSWDSVLVVVRCTHCPACWQTPSQEHCQPTGIFCRPDRGSRQTGYNSFLFFHNLAKNHIFQNFLKYVIIAFCLQVSIAVLFEMSILMSASHCLTGLPRPGQCNADRWSSEGWACWYNCHLLPLAEQNHLLCEWTLLWDLPWDLHTGSLVFAKCRCFQIASCDHIYIYTYVFVYRV